MADPRRLVHEIDVREALDFLAAMIRFRSYVVRAVSGAYAQVRREVERRVMVERRLLRCGEDAGEMP